MFARRSILVVFALHWISASGQTLSYYTAYQSSFPRVSSCPSGQYFDVALLQCSNCPTGTVQKATGQTETRRDEEAKGEELFSDFKQCDCADPTFYYGVNQGGGALMCLPCGANQVRDEFDVDREENQVRLATIERRIRLCDDPGDGVRHDQFDVNLL